MSSHILAIGKASPIGIEQITDAVINITEPLPEMPYPNGLEELGKYYDAQAQDLEEILIECLPGGTYDRLLGRMLARKATHFRVSHFGANL